MSYDIYLKDGDGNVLEMEEAIEEGGNYEMGGTKDCALNVTWNYCIMFDFKGKLNEKVAKDTLDDLKEFSRTWSNAKPWPDYWAPTPGNVKKTVDILISFAEKHLEGVWDVH